MKDKIIFRQLSNGQSLSDISLTSICDLIYDTDPYIYPCLLGNRDDARPVLKDLLHSGADNMFNLDNICIAETEGRVVGLLLWKQGPLIWNSDPLLGSFSNHSVSAPSGFSKVCSEYFHSYIDTPGNVINILNLCVDLDYRRNRIGSRLISSFIETHPGCIMKLHVLAENPAAIKLYSNAGFEIKEAIDGFSDTTEKPLCYLMEMSPGKHHFKCLGPDCHSHCCSVYSGFDDRLRSSEGNLFSEIILTDDDVNQITEAGYGELIRSSANGRHKVISTAPDGVCFALNNGICSIYESRPAICRAYPLYLDMFAGMTEQKECPEVESSGIMKKDSQTVEALLSVYEYWLDYYRDLFGLRKEL